MKERTINGKSIEQVFRELSEPIPGVVKKNESGQPYLNINTMIPAFDRLIPPKNYDMTCTEPQLHVIEGKYFFTSVVTITVYDDDGNKVVTKSYIGANDLIVKKTGELKNPAMDAKNAAVDGRKACMRWLGCGARQMDAALAESKPKKTDWESSEQSSSYSSAQPAQTQSGPKEGNGVFKIVCRDFSKAKNFNNRAVFPVVLPQMGNYKTEFLIWKDKVTEQELDDLISRLRAGQELTVRGKYESYKGNFRISFVPED